MNILMVQRATFNKNTNFKVIEYLGEVSSEELIKKRSSCVKGTIKEDSSLLELFGHLVYVEIFAYQLLKSKGLKGEYDEDLFKLDASALFSGSEVKLEELIELLKKSSTAVVRLFETLEDTSFDGDNFTPPTSMEDATAATFVELLFTHSMHHRGQISQVFAELGIGEDISRYFIYGFNR